MPSATDTLINDARCIEDCIPGSDMKLAVLISLFARIAGVSANTDSLIAGAKCIQPCIPGTDMKLAVLISLAQQIAGGSGNPGLTYFNAQMNGTESPTNDLTPGVIADLTFGQVDASPASNFVNGVWTAPRSGLMHFDLAIHLLGDFDNLGDPSIRWEAFLHFLNRVPTGYPSDGVVGAYGAGGDQIIDDQTWDGGFYKRTVACSQTIRVVAGDRICVAAVQNHGSGASQIFLNQQGSFFQGFYVN